MRETQLFNLAQNPHELLSQQRSEEVIALTGYKPEKEERNLADDPEQAGKLAEMRRLDEPYRLWTQPDDGLPVPTIREKVNRPKRKRSRVPSPSAEDRGS